MANMQELLNTIRSNASAQYQARIPEATRGNIEDIRFAMIDDDNIMVANEFMRTLLNKIVKSVVHAKRFSNPLKSLKKGKKPLGDTIEEIFVNFIKSETKGDGSELLSRKLPDVKTVYHRMNYESKYKVSVDRTRLSKAFASYDALETFIVGIINSLYNSAELDEFINMKTVIASAWNAGAIKKIPIADITDEASGKEFLKSVKIISGLMKFPSENYNGYLDVQKTDTVPITTFSRLEEQVLIIDVATNINVAVDVLASVFNMSVADFNNTKKIVIDSFPMANTIRAILADEQFFQVWDDYLVFKEFDNGDGLYSNFFLHIGQTIAFSPLVNAVGWYAEPVNPTNAEPEE